MPQSISVIIPNYNGRHLLETILPTLYGALRKINLSYEIIVADDASTDDSLTYLQMHYPEIIITQNLSNAGFSVTVNKGAGVARNQLLFFLNNDVKLTDDYFVSLIKYFDKEDTFGVNGRVIGWEDNTIQDAAKLPYFQGAKLKTSRNYYYRESSTKEAFTFYLTGSNALIDRDKFKEIGGFNEIFSPFYCEDLELSVRAWKSGWKCYYEHNAICRHKVSATTSSLQKKKYVEIIYNRNKFSFHYMHLSGLSFSQYLFQVLAEAIGKLLLFNKSYLQSFIEFLKIIRLQKQLTMTPVSRSNTISIQQIIRFIEQEIGQMDIIQFKN